MSAARSSAGKPAKSGKPAIPQKTPAWLSDLRYGKAMSVEFFRHNAWLILVFLVVVISMIGLRYKTKTKMAEIKRLEKELDISQSEKLQEKAAYMSLIRETEMKRLVEQKGLGLDFQEQPPYEVIVD